MSGTRICPHEWWISALFVFFIFSTLYYWVSTTTGLESILSGNTPSLLWQQHLNPNYLSGMGTAEEAKEEEESLFFLDL